MIELKTTESDDPQFVEIVSQILNSAINCYKPNEVYAVNLDNWFDHKWNAFAAVVFLQLGVWRSSELRTPPFNPNRVKSQSYFRLDEITKTNFIACDAPPLHIRQSSLSNLDKCLHSITDAGLFVWYSDNTKANGRGSLMVYSIGKEEPINWYVSFYKKQKWQMNKIQNLSKKVLEGWLNHSELLVTA
jgi:hypothetical protein